MSLNKRQLKKIYLVGILIGVGTLVLYNRWSSILPGAPGIISSSGPGTVILLTQRRSGSSILGELFNQYVDVSYFYEPLFPIDETCNPSLRQNAVEIVQRIINCDLNQLPMLYEKAFNVTDRNDKYSRCKIHNVCFAGNTQSKYSAYLTRDAKICNVVNNFQYCPEPIDLERLSAHCRGSVLIATKMIYLCKLEWISSFLSPPSASLKVLHLVRDPRATINSRIPARNSDSGSNTARLGGIRFYAKQICEKLSVNTAFANRAVGTVIPHDKYMRIRHEDFSMDPIKTAEKIYEFVSIPFDVDIKRWLVEATSFDKSLNLKVGDQGTKRNSRDIVSAWRMKLTFEEVVVIQDICKDALTMLGYEVYNTNEDMLDLNKLHFTSKTII
uniref:Sulfotransferase n=2 Tax=Ciona savignyi TaxID=51511 RepID=H2YAG4_CIOSA